MREHLNLTNYQDGCNLLRRPCLFQSFGCNFEGLIYQLERHEHEERQYHYYLLCESGYRNTKINCFDYCGQHIWITMVITFMNLVVNELV